MTRKETETTEVRKEMPTASGREGGEGCLSFPGLFMDRLSAPCTRSVSGLLIHAWAADLPAVPQGLTTQQPKGVFSGAAPWAQGFSVLPSGKGLLLPNTKSFRAQSAFPSVGNAVQLIPSLERKVPISEAWLKEKKSHTRFQKEWAPVPAFHMIA